ncbi:putative membrane protein [Streptococcus pneumoniae GA41565]|nr:putative membrane protein [Streptococcus pneumoniae GA41565]
MRGFRPNLLAFTFFFDGISVYAFCFALRPLLQSPDLL